MCKNLTKQSILILAEALHPNPENLVNFEHPIDIPGQDLDELTTQVFQYDPPDWEISDEFLADVDVVYLEKDISSSIAILAQIYSTFLLSICTFVVFLL